MEQIKRPSRGITPELIVSKLFNFHNKAHFLHLNADTIGKHILLDALYKDLVEHKDSIAEFLLGVQAPKRLGTFTLESVESFSDATMMKLINDGIAFSQELCEYAEANGWEELCNLSSELQSSFVKSKLFSTYK